MMSDEFRDNASEMGGNPQRQEWRTFPWREGVRSWDENLVTGMDSDGYPANAAPAPMGRQPVQSASSSKRPKGKKARKTTAESLLGALVYMFGVLIVSFILATVSWKWAGDLLALNKPEKTVTFTVSQEDSFGDVVSNLKEEGLIEYKGLFTLFGKFTHKAEKVTAGTYELNSEMDYSALLTGISSRAASRETATVTIPEGYTVKEVFQLLDSAGVCTVDELTKAAENASFDYDFIKGLKRDGLARLEGYLYPDTYEFYKGSDAEKVLCRLLDNFKVKFDEDLLRRSKELGYSRDEIIIMASIIEKETTGSDRGTISSVIHNRLTNPDHDDINGKLEMDSTVQYILSERKEKLTEKDLAIDSPYNTRLYAGLPVGPICNPGMESIRAALYPENTDYYYFMLGDDGEDHFFNDGRSFISFKNAQKGKDND